MTHGELEIEKLVKNPILKNQLQTISPKCQKFLSHISYFKVQQNIGKFPDAQDMSIIKERCHVGKATRKENDRPFSRLNPETNRTPGQHAAY